MGLFKRALKLTNWLLFDPDSDSRACVISFIELAKDQKKPIELVANKGGIVLRFRKEF